MEPAISGHGGGSGGAALAVDGDAAMEAAAASPSRAAAAPLLDFRGLERFADASAWSAYPSLRPAGEGEASVASSDDDGDDDAASTGSNSSGGHSTDGGDDDAAGNPHDLDGATEYMHLIAYFRGIRGISKSVMADFHLAMRLVAGNPALAEDIRRYPKTYSVVEQRMDAAIGLNRDAVTLHRATVTPPFGAPMTHTLAQLDPLVVIKGLLRREVLLRGWRTCFDPMEQAGAVSHMTETFFIRKMAKAALDRARVRFPVDKYDVAVLVVVVGSDGTPSRNGAGRLTVEHTVLALGNMATAAYQSKEAWASISAGMAPERPKIDPDAPPGHTAAQLPESTIKELQLARQRGLAVMYRELRGLCDGVVVGKDEVDPTWLARHCSADKELAIVTTPAILCADIMGRCEILSTKANSPDYAYVPPEHLDQPVAHGEEPTYQVMRNQAQIVSLYDTLAHELATPAQRSAAALTLDRIGMRPVPSAALLMHDVASHSEPGVFDLVLFDTAHVLDHGITYYVIKFAIQYIMAAAAAEGGVGRAKATSALWARIGAVAPFQDGYRAHHSFANMQKLRRLTSEETRCFLTALAVAIAPDNVLIKKEEQRLALLEVLTACMVVDFEIRQRRLTEEGLRRLGDACACLRARMMKVFGEYSKSSWKFIKYFMINPAYVVRKLRMFGPMQTTQFLEASHGRFHAVQRNTNHIDPLFHTMLLLLQRSLAGTYLLLAGVYVTALTPVRLRHRRREAVFLGGDRGNATDALAAMGRDSRVPYVEHALTTYIQEGQGINDVRTADALSRDLGKLHVYDGVRLVDNAPYAVTLRIERGDIAVLNNGARVHPLMLLNDLRKSEEQFPMLLVGQFYEESVRDFRRAHRTALGYLELAEPSLHGTAAFVVTAVDTISRVERYVPGFIGLPPVPAAGGVTMAGGRRAGGAARGPLPIPRSPSVTGTVAGLTVSRHVAILSADVARGLPAIPFDVQNERASAETVARIRGAAAAGSGAGSAAGSGAGSGAAGSR